MEHIIFILIVGITIYLIYTILKKREKKQFLEASKKWESVVEELRKRK